MTFDDVQAALHDAGLTPRGAFRVQPDDLVPEVGAQIPARTVALAGGAGPHMWSSFLRARESGAETLDAWAEAILNELAARFGARAVFPFQCPHLPFQRWAMRAEACHPSPVGMLIHPDYGLWHNYRGALLFAGELDLPSRDVRPSPCESCGGKPCLRACPVAAFHARGYEVSLCSRHLDSIPEPSCLDIGCLPRHACPVGRAWAYAPAQARFHLEAFRRSVRRAGSQDPVHPQR